MEVEAIGHVRHKNLVRLLGYCIEGTHRYPVVLVCILFGFNMQISAYAFILYILESAKMNHH